MSEKACQQCGKTFAMVPHGGQKRYCSGTCRVAAFYKRNPDWKRGVVAGMPEYQSWRMMIQRCTNPKRKGYQHYGGRGITVCDRWRHSFEAFLSDVGERPPETELDRIDNDGNYEPGNCRWASASENSNNKSTNLLIEYDGRIQTATEWARETGVSRQVIRSRLAAGWPLDKVLSKQLFRGGQGPNSVSRRYCAPA